jgi:uncharacterized membrane protein YhdT
MILYIAALTISRANAFYESEYMFYFATINLSWMAVVYVNSLYLSKDWLNFENFSKRTLTCYVLTMMFTLLAIFLSLFIFQDIHHLNVRGLRAHADCEPGPLCSYSTCEPGCV